MTQNQAFASKIFCVNLQLYGRNQYRVSVRFNKIQINLAEKTSGNKNHQHKYLANIFTSSDCYSYGEQIG